MNSFIPVCIATTANDKWIKISQHSTGNWFTTKVCRMHFWCSPRFLQKSVAAIPKPNPFNQQKALINELFRSPTRLPFYFDWLDGHMIVTRNFTPNHLLPPGTEVKKINGVPTSAVLRKLLSIARADGANDSKRVAQLAVNGYRITKHSTCTTPCFFLRRAAPIRWSS